MEEVSRNRWLFAIGTLAFLVTLVFSVVFYKERMAFTDAAFHLYHIIVGNGFQIQSHRYVAYFTQAFAVFPVRAGMPLDQIALLYSISFPLLYLVAFWILTLVLKNYRMALAYLLFSFLMTRASFYWCLSDLVQGHVFLFLYFASLQYKPLLRRALAVRVLQYGCLFFSVFSHPLMIFSALFLFAFFWIRDQDRRKSLLIQACIYTSLTLIKMVFFRSGTDATAGGAFVDGLRNWRDFFQFPSNRNFVRYMIRDFHWVGLFWVCCLIYYARIKNWLQFLLIGGSFVGFTLLNNFAVREEVGQFYIESHYLGLCLFVVVPLVWDLLPRLRDPRMIKFGVPALLLLSLIGIYRHHVPFTDRTDALRDQIADMQAAKSDKWIVSEQTLPLSKIFMSWALSYEVWLLSTIEQKETYSMLAHNDENEYFDLTRCNTCFGTIWGYAQYHELPERYFIFRHRDFPYTNH